MRIRLTEAPPQLKRLDEIAGVLQEIPGALALIGLGSVGLELERLDAYSDLDFFVIVAEGHKEAFMQELDWLVAAHPLGFAFQNTPDGYKALFEDGIFCEFAVFELPELSKIPYAPGRIVWKCPEVGDWISQPQRQDGLSEPQTTEWLLGEALTNLYVGLGRYQRGEKLSAARFVQGYAVERVIELYERVSGEPASPGDPFSPERRLEQRYPGLAAQLPAFLQGYERTPQSALAILAFLKNYFTLNPAMEKAILDLGESSPNQQEA